MAAHPRSWLLPALCLVLGLSASAQRTGGGGAPRNSPSPVIRFPNANANSGPQNQTVIPAVVSTRSAHHAEQEEKITFRSETQLVTVPVVVTDKAGGHVIGLKQEDFTVLEDGKPQKISVFQAVASVGNRVQPPPRKPGQFTNVAPDSQPTRVTVILLDCVNTPYLDQAYARKELIQFLATRLQPTESVALLSLTTRGLTTIHDFTSDPELLLAALQKVSGSLPLLQGTSTDVVAAAASPSPDAGLPVGLGASIPDPNFALQEFVTSGDVEIAGLQQGLAINRTVSAFSDIANALAGIPGRKSLVWVTAGFPFYLDTASATPPGEMATYYERSMRALSDANVAIYPIDARGLVNYLSISDASTNLSTNPAVRSAQDNARAWLHYSTLDTLTEFADMTGGRAFFNTNDLANSFARASDDSAAYYMLGYYLDTKNTKPGWRKLKVKVDRPNVDIRTRSGYFATNGAFDYDSTRRMDVDTALVSPLDSTGIPLVVQFGAPTADGDARRVPFAVHIAGNAIGLSAAAQNRFSLEVVGVVRSGSFDAGHFLQRLEGNVKPENLAQLQAGSLKYHNEFRLAPGRYTVRFVVRDDQSGRLGSLSAPLVVN